MPPKKDSGNLLFLKAKRQASTYFVGISKKDTVNQLKNVLVDMINQSGGLKLDDSPVPMNDDLEQINDQQMVVPKIGLNDSSDSEEENHDAGKNQNDDSNDAKSDDTEMNDPNRVKLTVDEITLGSFDNMNNIYSSNVSELTIEDGTKIETLFLQDFALIPFKYKDENFNIFKPQD